MMSDEEESYEGEDQINFSYISMNRNNAMIKPIFKVTKEPR